MCCTACTTPTGPGGRLVDRFKTDSYDNFEIDGTGFLSDWTPSEKSRHGVRPEFTRLLSQGWFGVPSAQPIHLPTVAFGGTPRPALPHRDGHHLPGDRRW